MWKLLLPRVPQPRVQRPRRRCFRPQLEPLEDRLTPGGAGVEWSDPFSSTNQVVLGNPYVLSLTNPSTTVSSWTINWGDGNIQTVPGNPSSVAHTYAAPGSYSVSASATDASGTNPAAVSGLGQFLSTFVNNSPYRFNPQFSTPAQPIGLTFGPDGNLYVADQILGVLRYNGTTGAFMDNFANVTGNGFLSFGPDGNLYVETGDTIVRVNGVTGAFMNVFVASQGILSAQGLAFGPDGNLYVANSRNNSVMKYNGTTGAPLGTFVASGSGGLSQPEGIAFGPDGNLYVCSFKTGQVLRYSGTTGAFMNVFASASGFDTPFDMRFGPDGNLYVTRDHPGAPQVVRFNGSTGAFMNVFASSATGYLSGPAGLTFDQSGNLYVANETPTNSRVSRFSSSGAFLGIFTPEKLSNLEDMVRGPDGNFYTTDAGLNEVQRFSGTTGAYMGIFVSPYIPTNYQGFHDLTFGPDGNLYVDNDNPLNNYVVEFAGPSSSTPGAFIKTFIPGGSKSKLNSPKGLVFQGGNLYISNSGANDVLEYNGSTGAFITTFVSGSSKQNGGLAAPQELLFGPDGTLYVSSGGTGSVLHYSSTGKFLGAFVTSGSGGLQYPRGLAFGLDGNFYVADANGSQVLRYNGTTGAFLNAFVPAGSENLPGAISLTFANGNLYVTCDANYTNRVLVYNGTTGAVVGPLVPVSLYYPQEETFGPDGNLYVSSPGNLKNEVLRYNGATGAFMGIFAYGGGLNYPRDLTFGPDGNLYVVSQNSNQVLRYNGTTGAFMNVFVAAGSGGLSSPINLAFGPDGNLYVDSTGNSSVIEYNGSTGGLVGTFVASGSGGLSSPRGMKFGPDGNLYVGSDGTGQVLRYSGPNTSSPGSFLGAINTFGGPTGLAFGPDGDLYVTGSYLFHASVLRFDGTTFAFLGEAVQRGGQPIQGLPDATDIAFGGDGNLYILAGSYASVASYDGPYTTTTATQITVNVVQAHSYASTNVPLTIPAGGSVTSTLAVADSYSIASVSMQTNITYPNNSDLSGYLIGPDGTRVILFGSGTSPTGTFQSIAFDGRNVQGTWSLLITNSGTSTGTLNSWSMTIVDPPAAGVRSQESQASSQELRTNFQEPKSPFQGLVLGTWFLEFGSPTLLGGRTAGYGRDEGEALRQSLWASRLQPGSETPATTGPFAGMSSLAAESSDSNPGGLWEDIDTAVLVPVITDDLAGME